MRGRRRLVSVCYRDSAWEASDARRDCIAWRGTGGIGPLVSSRTLLLIWILVRRPLITGTCRLGS
jgi:hypothetical protein